MPSIPRPNSMPADPLVAGERLPWINPFTPRVMSAAKARGMKPYIITHGVRNNANTRSSNRTSEPTALTMLSPRINCSASSDTRYAPAA